jgi:hypothetical protein
MIVKVSSACLAATAVVLAACQDIATDPVERRLSKPGCSSVTGSPA